MSISDMRFKGKIDIPQDNPFKNDLFGRQMLANKIIELTKASNDNFIACIDSPYGYGKTTFFDMTMAYANNLPSIEGEDDVICIKYDAWDNDFFEDPLISIISVFHRAIENYENVNVEDLKIALIDIGMNATKVLTKGIVNLEKTHRKFKRENSKRSVITNYLDHLQSREFIKDTLSNLSKDNSNFKRKKVIFLIDELDRCKPTYALKFLEVIKHYFDTEKFYFLLTIDKKQLESTVKKHYGADINADEYLKRFFDFDISLPAIDCDKYIENYQMDKFSNYTNFDILFKVLRDFTKYNEMSLRSIDKLMFYLRLISAKVSSDIGTTRDASYHFKSVTYATLLLLKVTYSELSKQFFTKKFTDFSPSTDLNVLHLEKLSTDMGNFDSHYLKALSEFYKILFKTNANNFKKNSKLYDNIADESSANLLSSVIKCEYEKLRSPIIDNIQLLDIINSL